MRWYLGILAVVIFLAASAISWGHSMKFFADNGFGGGYDPLFGVVLLECLFLMGAGAELYNQKNGRKSTLSIKLALWGGGGVVLWANLRYGWDHGVEGVTAGLVVVAALLVAESILADIFLSVRKAAEEADRIREPEPVEDSPAAMGENVRQVGDGLGDHPEPVGDSPNKMGEIPTTGEDSPNDLGEIREIVGKDLGEVGETTQQTGDHPEGAKEIREESPKEQGEPVGDHPPRRRFTQAEIEEMASQIHLAGESPSKREIMSKLSISDHYAKKVMKALKALKTQGGIENEKDRKPARIETPAHGKQSNNHFTTDDRTGKNPAEQLGA